MFDRCSFKFQMLPLLMPTVLYEQLHECPSFLSEMQKLYWYVERLNQTFGTRQFVYCYAILYIIKYINVICIIAHYMYIYILHYVLISITYMGSNRYFPAYRV